MDRLLSSPRRFAMTDQRSKMLFLFFAIACTALRVYLKLTAIDPATGFYEGGGAAVPALWVLAAAALLAIGFFGITAVWAIIAGAIAGIIYNSVKAGVKK